MSALVVLCTCPSREVGTQLAETLVTEKLAACVNIIPKIQSVYMWEGAVCQEEEVLLVIKTTENREPALRARLVTMHPYECPEVIGLPIQRGHGPYLQWIEAETQS